MSKEEEKSNTLIEILKIVVPSLTTVATAIIGCVLGAKKDKKD